jgi:hypothetical protein
MTNKLPPGRAEDRRQADGFAGDNERRKRFVLGGATTSGTAANRAMSSASGSTSTRSTTSSKMGSSSSQTASRPSTSTSSTGARGPTGPSGQARSSPAGNAGGSPGSTSRSPSGGGFGGGGSGNNNPSGGARPSGGFSQSQFGSGGNRPPGSGGGGGGGQRPSGAPTSPGGGGMGLNNARKGSSITDVGKNSGTEAPGNMGRGVGGGTSPAMAALQDRVDNRAMAKSLTTASLLGDTKPRAPTAGRGTVVPTAPPQIPSAQKLTDQYTAPITMSNDAVVPGYNNSFENRENSVNALRDTMDALTGTPNNPYTKDMDRTIRTLAGEAGLRADNVTPRGSVGDVANVMVNRGLVSNIEGLDQFNNNLADKGQWEAYKTDAYKLANPGSAIAQNVAEAAIKGLMDGPVVPNATGFRSSATTNKDGVNVGGNVFGNFDNITGDQMSAIRGDRFASLGSMDTGVNAPTMQASAPGGYGNFNPESPVQQAAVDRALTNTRLAMSDRVPSQYAGYGTFNAPPVTRPTSVADVFNGIGEGLGSIFGQPTAAEAETVRLDRQAQPFGPYTNKDFHSRVPSEVRPIGGEGLVGGLGVLGVNSDTGVHNQYSYSDPGVAPYRQAIQDTLYGPEAPPRAPTVGRSAVVPTAPPPGSRFGEPDYQNVEDQRSIRPGISSGMSFNGIQGATIPGLSENLDPFSPGDRGISKPANPYTARKGTERVVGDAIVSSGGVGLPGMVHTNISDKVGLPAMTPRTPIGGMDFTGMPGQMDVPYHNVLSGPIARPSMISRAPASVRRTSDAPPHAGTIENRAAPENFAVTGDPRESMQSALEAYRNYMNGTPEHFNAMTRQMELSNYALNDKMLYSDLQYKDPEAARKKINDVFANYAVDVPYTDTDAPPIETSVDVPYREPTEDGPFTNPQLVDPHAPGVKYPRQAIKTIGNMVFPGAGWLADKLIGWDMDRINQMTPEQQAAIQARWKQENKAFLRGDAGGNGGGGNAYIPPNYYNAFPSALGYGGSGGGYASGDGDDDGNPATPPAGDGTDASSGNRRRRLGMPDPYTYGYSPEYSYFTYV